MARFAQQCAASVLAVALVALAGCSDDESGDKPTRRQPAAAYDKDVYCELVEALPERDERPEGEPFINDDFTISPAGAKAYDTFTNDNLRFVEKVLAAAPEHLRAEWNSLLDVYKETAKTSRMIVDPDFQAEFARRSERERVKFLYSQTQGWHAGATDKSTASIAEHAESECDVVDMFEFE